MLRLALVALVLFVSGCTGVTVRWWNDHDKPPHWADGAGTAIQADTFQRSLQRAR